MGKTVEGVVMTVHMPKAVLNMNLTATQGSYTFDPVTKVSLKFLFKYWRWHYYKSPILQNTGTVFHTRQKTLFRLSLWIKNLPLKFAFSNLDTHQLWLLVSLVPFSSPSSLFTLLFHPLSFFLSGCSSILLIFSAMIYFAIHVMETYFYEENALALKMGRQRNWEQEMRKNFFQKICWKTHRKTKCLKEHVLASLPLSWGLRPKFHKAPEAF